MKFLHVILSLSLLLFVPLLVVGSSSSSSSEDNNLVRNITRGSSLSLNDTDPYWLSPSSNIAFGFYQLPGSPNQYTVGIWLVKSSHKTLVWTVKDKNLITSVHKPSSLFFTRKGKLVLKILPDNKVISLLHDAAEPVSYAKLHDNGNFVLYGSDSQIVWESFDYPTDTILGGQKLKAGTDLISGNYKLSVRETDGLVSIYNMHAITDWFNSGYRKYRTRILKVVADGIKGAVSTPLTLNLDITGNLSLVGSDDVVLKYVYRNKNQHRRKEAKESTTVKENAQNNIYRATLDSSGHFNLYKESINGGAIDNDKSSSNVVPLWSSDSYRRSTGTNLMAFIIIAVVINIIYF